VTFGLSEFYIIMRITQKNAQSTSGSRIFFHFDKNLKNIYRVEIFIFNLLLIFESFRR